MSTQSKYSYYVEPRTLEVSDRPRKFISSRSNVPPPEGSFPKPIDNDEFLAAVERLLSAS